MRKLLTIVLAVLMAFGTCSLTACGPKGGDGFDKTKTQLYVGLFKAGLGREWLDQAKIDFEEKYKDVSFEEGKTGVEVVIDYKVTEFKVGTFQTNVPSLSNSIYFLDQSDYAAYASSGILKDVTDILNKDVYDADGEIVDVTFDKGTNALSFAEDAQKSMLDGMTPEYVNSFNRNGKYFGSPYRNIVTGMVYDADYFNEAKLYAFKDENPETGDKLGATMADVVAGENADGLEIGYGPDGLKGTLDDGMPETWDDFMYVLDNMGGATPFIWSGAESYQRWYFYMNVWANYEGYNNFKINYSFSGNHSDLGEIKPENAIEKLSEQLGRKAAIQAMYDMQAKASNVYSGWKNTDEYQSELQFIRSKNENKRIAMLLDGGYWEVNMISEFDKMAQKDANDGYGKRDFRLFPIPNFDGQTNTDPTEVFYCAGPGLVCMPAKYKGQNALQNTLAELFYYFTHSREQMVKFTGYTGGCVKPYAFEVKDSDTQYLTKFGKNILERISDEGAKMISDTPTSDVVKANESILYSENDGYFRFRIVSGGVNYTDPISWFIGAGNGKTVEETFNTIKNNIKTNCVLR